MFRSLSRPMFILRREQGGLFFQGALVFADRSVLVLGYESCRYIGKLCVVGVNQLRNLCDCGTFLEDYTYTLLRACPRLAGGFAFSRISPCRLIFVILSTPSRPR